MVKKLETSILITQEEKDLRKQRRNKVFLHSNFSFLNSHKGFRPANIHLIVGTSSGGKSTLLRSLCIDVVNNENKKAGVFLSEDPKTDFLDDMSFTGYPNFKNITALSEADERPSSASECFNLIREFIQQDCLDVLFIDNLTTSICYEGRTPKEQAIIATQLKRLAADFNIPIVPIIHTQKGIDENFKGLIGKDHVRGTNTIVNQAQFLYVMQSFYVGKKRFDTIRTCKHRSQEVNATVFKLVFNSQARLYAGDETIDFSELKSFFNLRNKL